MAQPHEVFSSLHTVIQGEDYEEAIKISNKILASTPNDEDAFRCVVLSLIHLGKFSEATNQITAQQADKFLFERAYISYREKRYIEALKLLEEAPKDISKFSELKAQVYYGMEKFDEAEEIYFSLLSNSTPTTDLLSNLAACFVKTGNLTGLNKLISDFPAQFKSTFELAYNAGTLYLERGDLAKAEEFLTLSKTICQTNLSAQGFSEREIADERSIIDTQLLCLKQRSGAQDVVPLYEEMLTTKPSDLTVAAVCANNIVTLRDGEKFDSLRKFQALNNEKTQSKLSSNQFQIVGFNHCLLLTFMNKFDEARNMLQGLTTQFPANDLFVLLQATSLYKERKFTKAQALLEEFIAKNPASVKAGLALAQMHLSQSQIPLAVKTMRSIQPLKTTPAMVCAIVTLCERMNDLELALSVLDEAVRGLKETDVNFNTLLKFNGSFKLTHGRYYEAAQVFKKLQSMDKSDRTHLLHLIIAYSYSDPAKARELESSLPPFTSSVNAEELENLLIPTARPVYKQKAKPTDQVTTEKPITKPKKKSKKKNKPAKNMDPKQLPDPDRWKPKHERASYKPRRKGHQQQAGSRGAQGCSTASIMQQQAQKGPSLVSGTAVAPGLPPQAQATQPAATPTTQPAAPAAAPAQPKPAQPQQARKGGKKGGKRR